MLGGLGWFERRVTVQDSWIRQYNPRSSPAATAVKVMLHAIN